MMLLHFMRFVSLLCFSKSHWCSGTWHWQLGVIDVHFMLAFCSNGHLLELLVHEQGMIQPLLRNQISLPLLMIFRVLDFSAREADNLICHFLTYA